MIDKINYIPIIKQITSYTITPYLKKENTFLNTIIFLDDKSHPFMLIAESPTQLEVEINNEYSSVYKKIDYTIHSKLQAIKNAKGLIFEIFDLDYTPSKKMTKKEIEELLGYKIKIVE